MKLSTTLVSTKFKATTALCAFALCATGASASVVGNGLLDTDGASLITTTLADGPKTYTNIFSGVAGQARASDFHAAADGVGPTVTVYGITLSDGTRARIGGYTTADWGAQGYQRDTSAFLFNLDTDEIQFANGYGNGSYATYSTGTYFPTFGGGHDLFAGRDILGQCGSSTSTSCDGYSYSWAYDHSQGQIAVAGDTGSGWGSAGTRFETWSVNSIDVYTVTEGTISAVPLPAGAPLLLLGIGAFAGLRARKKAKSA